MIKWTGSRSVFHALYFLYKRIFSVVGARKRIYLSSLKATKNPDFFPMNITLQATASIDKESPKNKQDQIQDILCSSCGLLFKPKSSRSRKCLNCGYVGYKRNNKIVSKNDASKYDTNRMYEWAADQIGFGKDALYHVVQNSTTIDTHLDSIQHAFWSICKPYTQDLMSKGNYEAARISFYMQAKIEEKEGKNCIESLKSSLKCSLLKLKPHFKHVEILSNPECSACSKISQKILSIDEALEKMPIPVDGCDCSQCWCHYIPSRETSFD